MKRKKTFARLLPPIKQRGSGMKYKYDPETDILVIELSREKPGFAEQKGSIITHYSKENKPVELEILDASSTALEILKARLPQKIAVHSR